LRTRRGHDNVVAVCAVSPDGAHIVSVSTDQTVRMWDAASGREWRNLSGHAGWVVGCAFGPDGTWVVSTSLDGSLKVWDVASGRVRLSLAGHRGWVVGCAVSPDGGRIVSAGEDGTVRVWDAATGQMLHTLIGHTDQVVGCAVSPDGGWIVSGGRDGTLRLWRLTDGTPMLVVPLLGALRSVALHPWRPVAACGGGLDPLVIDLVGIEYGPIIVTAWRFTLRFVSRKPASLAFGCLDCRTWSEIPESALGSEIPCPNCGKPVRLNPFTVEGDWRKISEAWKVGK